MTPTPDLHSLERSAQRFSTALNGGELVWRRWSSETASGRPLVLLHGGFGSWTHWAANIEGLRQHRTLWVVDLPGLGDSADLPAPQTTRHFATALLNSLRKLLGAEREFDLAGFSFGAMLGAAMAELAGAQCKHCIVIGAAGCGELHVQVDLLPLPHAGMTSAETNATQRENLRRLMLARPERIDAVAVDIHADNLARHRLRSRKLAKSNDLLKALPGMDARLIGIWGELDATAGGCTAIEARRELFQRAQPASEFYILQGVGHWAMYEVPEQINRLLIESCREEALRAGSD